MFVDEQWGKYVFDLLLILYKENQERTYIHLFAFNAGKFTFDPIVPIKNSGSHRAVKTLRINL